MKPGSMLPLLWAAILPLRGGRCSTPTSRSWSAPTRGGSWGSVQSTARARTPYARLTSVWSSASRVWRWTTDGASRPCMTTTSLSSRCTSGVAEHGLILALTSSIYYVGPDMSYCMPVHIQRVAMQFPQVPIVVPHAFWPWVTEGCGVAFQNSNVYLVPDFYGYIPNSPGAEEYVKAANYYLGYRLLFASSYPIRAARTERGAVCRPPVQGRRPQATLLGRERTTPPGDLIPGMAGVTWTAPVRFYREVATMKPTAPSELASRSPAGERPWLDVRVRR